MAADEEDTTVYHVVVNHEEQYSIWPASRALPAGWHDVGKSGPKGGMSRLHQRGVDRHATAERSQSHGSKGPISPGVSAQRSL